jgi:hypothetical protein
MAEAKFLYGNPLMVKHTPTSVVAAGEVVELIADTGPIGIAHNRIPANGPGNLSFGPGVYECVCADASVALGSLVYWDTAANKVTTTATTNPSFGRTLKATVGTDEKIPVALEYQAGP